MSFLPGFYSFCLSCALCCSLAVLSLRISWEKASNTAIRREAARLLGQIGQCDSSTVDILLSSLLDEDGDVRSACAQTLARLGKRSTAMIPLIEKRLVQVIQDPQFGKPDRLGGRPAYDYAYDGLWSLAVSSEDEEH